MNGPRPTRRDVLGFLAALIGLAATPVQKTVARPARVSGDSLLQCIFRDRESAAAVGAEYLRAAPEENDLAALRRLLDLPAAPEAAPTNRHAQTARLRERHRGDFREGRVRRIAGWTLSLTELRLCALVLLDGGEQGESPARALP